MALALSALSASAVVALVEPETANATTVCEVGKELAPMSIDYGTITTANLNAAKDQFGLSHDVKIQISRDDQDKYHKDAAGNPISGIWRGEIWKIKSCPGQPNTSTPPNGGGSSGGSSGGASSGATNTSTTTTVAPQDCKNKSTPASDTALNLGDCDEDVWAAQVALQEIMPFRYDLVMDGNFGKETRTAVYEFNSCTAHPPTDLYTLPLSGDQVVAYNDLIAKGKSGGHYVVVSGHCTWVPAGPPSATSGSSQKGTSEAEATKNVAVAAGKGVVTGGKVAAKVVAKLANCLTNPVKWRCAQ